MKYGTATPPFLSTGPADEAGRQQVFCDGKATAHHLVPIMRVGERRFQVRPPVAGALGSYRTADAALVAIRSAWTDSDALV